MITDTERLEWYVRHVAEGIDPLSYRMAPDKQMGITAFGQITEHELWHWPMDRSNAEYADFRIAIDERLMAERRTHPEREP